MTATRLLLRSALLASAVLSACTPAGPDINKPTNITAANHRWFPLTEGTVHALGKIAGPDGAITCDSCHRPTAESLTQVRCDQCHKHTEQITQRLHLAIPASFNVDTSAVSDPDLKAELRGANCYKCHEKGEKRPFSHKDPMAMGGHIATQCAECHAEGNAFASLPKAGFDHQEIGTTDCSSCHQLPGMGTFDAPDWLGAGNAPNDASDPINDLVVTAKLPTFAATSIAQVTDQDETLPMPMNHRASSIDAGMLLDCEACHADSKTTGKFEHGQLHWSLDNAAQPQPTRCSECHVNSRPTGFVGPIATAVLRSPPTGEMRHDAVAWANGAPTTTRLVPDDCAVCHAPPDPTGATTWRFELDGGFARFHASLTAAGKPQPASCLDCHANTRPTLPLTSATASVPAGMTFDHQAGNALNDCSSCHTSTASWAGGKFHAGNPTPSTCLPCHASERPKDTSGWTSTTYTRSPFDYGDTVINGQTVTHGAGEDCALCHSSSTQTWVGGNFSHGPANMPSALAAAACITCHLSQRPATPVTRPSATPFDHSTGGTGDCRACHQATVRAGTYVNLLPIPGGDWKGGVEYPADVPVASAQFVALTGFNLTRNASSFVTGVTSQSTNFYNAMLHTSTQVPAAVFPGPASAPVNSTCWHCHTHPAGSTTVSAYTNGKFHQALQSYTANIDGSGAMALAQPTKCRDCHEQMRPNFVLQKSGSVLQPMDHSITFTAPVSINGQSYSGVAAMECSSCHKASPTPGTQWSNGQFHANIGAAVPSDCVSCHYPLSVTASADVTIATTFAMKHKSPTLATTPLQKCETCHVGTIANGTATPIAAALWRTPGTQASYHAHVTPQPGSCLECHKVSQPAASTQGTTVYTLTQGGSATNGAQWMNHAVATVVALDCAACHKSDAKVTGSAWSRGPSFHANVTNPTACNGCHGTGNGKGAALGTNNNLPVGLTDTRSTTTASMWPGKKDQLTHGDLNVSAKECNFCHTQNGISSTAGVQGAEWKQAFFHKNFTAANPLVLNATTARCSNCHVNVKPGAGFSTDHSTFTATSAQDCSSCHTPTGTGTAAAPNWLGAAGKPHGTTGTTSGSTLDCNSCHGQNGSATAHLAVPIASHYGGITNGNKCISCHIEFTGFKTTVTNLKYAHTNATANSGGCVNCHAYASQLYTTLTNTPALNHPSGNGHQFSQALSITGTFSGQSFNAPHTNSKLQLCGNCHQYSATTAATNIWAFKHRPSNAGLSANQNSGGCNMCH